GTNEKFRDQRQRSALDGAGGGRVPATRPQHRVRMGSEREAAVAAPGLACPVPAVGTTSVARGTSGSEPESVSHGRAIPEPWTLVRAPDGRRWTPAERRLARSTNESAGPRSRRGP